MNSMLTKLSPTITNMIRMDHTHVMATFHQYEADTPAKTKEALVKTICLALEIHAQLEEEIFYPAMRELDADSQVVAKSKPEHDEMRRLVNQLRSMQPGDAKYDDTVMELMRGVMYHVADEETVLLPAAERLMPERLGELGAQMTKRRLQLAAPRAGEIASSTLKSTSTSKLVMTGGALIFGMLVAKRAFGRHPTAH